MQTFEWMGQVHAELGRLLENETDPQRIEHITRLRAETWARLRTESKKPRLMFAPHTDYVWLGPAQKPRAYLSPALQGLDDAWLILKNWTASHYAMHSTELDGSPSGNALNGRLKTAISWIEDAAGCRDLGHLLRQISVSRDGAVTPPQTEFYVQLHVDLYRVCTGVHTGEELQDDAGRTNPGSPRP